MYIKEENVSKGNSFLGVTKETFLSALFIGFFTRLLEGPMKAAMPVCTTPRLPSLSFFFFPALHWEDCVWKVSSFASVCSGSNAIAGK